MIAVIIESPFAGDIEANIEYAKAACLNAIERGYAPFASHLLYPQFLDDRDSKLREKGIESGYTFWSAAKYIEFFTDRGWSDGMKAALLRAYNYDDFKHSISLRSLKGEAKLPDFEFIAKNELSYKTLLRYLA